MTVYKAVVDVPALIAHRVKEDAKRHATAVSKRKMVCEARGILPRKRGL